MLPGVTAVPNTMMRNNSTASVGFRFRAVVNLSVIALGRSIGSPFTQSHLVRLWSDAGTQLAEITASSSSTVVSGYATNSVTPVSLTAGTYYRVSSQEFNGGDPWADIQSVPNNSSFIDSIQGAFLVAAGGGFPATVVSGFDGQGYVFPNLYFAAPVTSRRRRQSVSGGVL